ncbi:NACHT domain-containing protein [Streptomyces sp. NPDC021218]|uniref:NACHT domain-containing protein n=1 Tax=Streptomyces sp. NPDC021218 TaxID=3365119 RepID=UPI003793A3BA
MASPSTESGDTAPRQPTSDAPRFEVSGGRQRNVVQIYHVDRLELAAELGGSFGRYRRSGADSWFGWAAGLAAAAFAVFLLLARPVLPLPEGFDPGPVRVGWLLLASILVLAGGQRVLRRVHDRRMRLWLSAPYLARAVDELAEDLAARYDGDERWELIRDPEPIEVTWREEERDGDADARVPGGGPIAACFHATPAHRLVVMGGPGAGKSVLALRLATELLKERQTREGQGPVPVIVPLASWDPREGLFRWIARQVAVDHPRACAPVAGAPPVAVALSLLRTRRVLPILDGFDELPADVRKKAMRRLREGTKGGVPFVLTSRQGEFREHAPEQNVFARTEITLCPLADHAVAAYLNPGGRPRSRWSEVLARLDGAAADSPEARLRDVLRVPLMANLAREAYSEEGTDPRELLVPGAFADTAAIEHRLYDAYLDAIYSPSHEERTGWDPQTARAWAGFLATRMKADNLEELAWWRLDEQVPWRVRGLALVPAFALSVALMARLGLGAWGWPGLLGLSLWQAYAIVCALALLHMPVSAENAEHRPPQQIVRLTGTRLREAVSGWRGRTLGVLAAACLAAGWAATVSTRSGLWLWAMTAISWVTARWCGRRLLLAAADPSLAGSPGALLRSDRRAVCTLGWLFTAGPPALTVLCALPLASLGVWFAADAAGLTFSLSADKAVVGFLVDVLDDFRLPFAIVILNAAWSSRDRLVPLTLVLPLVMLALYAVTPEAQGVITTVDWALAALGALVCWLLYTTAVSAWGRFQVARLYLAATGRLPLRLMTFLKDAHQRGVLRQSGGAYSFRHIGLRDRLAQAGAMDTRAGTLRPGRGRQFTSGAIALALLMGTYAVTVRGAAQAEPVPGPIRSLPTACGLLDDRHIAALTDDARTHAPKPPTYTPFQWEPSCVVDEHAPKARTVRIEVGTKIVEPFYDQSAVRAASAQFKASSWTPIHFDLDGGTSRRLEGFGDEARLHTGPHRVGNADRPFPAAVVVVREDNALLTVRYTEEHADQARVTMVAKALAGAALRKAGLTTASAPRTPTL